MWPNKIGTALVSPVGTVLVLYVLAGLFSLLRRPRAAAALVGGATLWLLLWSLPEMSQRLRYALESQYPLRPVAELPTAPVIVVLGGAISAPTADYPLPGLTAAADRLWHGARLFRAGKAPLILLSGGAGGRGEIMSEAEAMKSLLRELGVPAEAIIVEGASRNTAGNAERSAALLRARGIQRVLLVTSALHMARAVMHFEAAGLEVVPAATDHEAHDPSGWAWAERWVPDAEALHASGRAMKEIVGRLVSAR